MVATLKLLTADQWKQIAPLLPEPKRSPKGGPHFIPNRRCFEGILWILWTGAQWRALPKEYPSPATCWRRLNRWMQEGVWEKAFATFVRRLKRRDQLRWDECFIDAMFAPAKKGALPSARPSAAREQRWWWWRTVRVFQSVTTYVRLPPTKPRSPKRPSRQRTGGRNG
jgi:transposase